MKDSLIFTSWRNHLKLLLINEKIKYELKNLKENFKLRQNLSEL
jgi:hypothetical protein